METRDVMTKDVVTLTPEMTLREAADVLLRYHIHGAPVVDETGMLVGMVSVIDLVGRVGKIVADVMTEDPVSASEDAPIEEVARQMLEQMVRRVPIIRAGRVVGIVSASDIIQLFLNLHERPAGGTGA
jgi:CBS domain-containing protein